MIRFAIAAALVVLSGAVASADPAGNWNTAEGKARVRIADCGGGLCATVLSLKEPNAPEGGPKLDIRNVDASKRTRPIVGISLLSGMAPQGDQWLGKIYNPEDGKTYKAYMSEQGSDKLKVQGCALGGLICKTQIWTRAK
jgi:uncharacterized protein (DUF2147 family)